VVISSLSPNSAADRFSRPAPPVAHIFTPVTAGRKHLDRFTDAESAKFPKLAIRQQTGDTALIKEAVDEYDCKRRAFRVRIWLYKDGAERKEKNLDWMEDVPGSVGEALLN